VIVTGYQSTVFHYEDLIIKLKIPDFQLEAIFTKEVLKRPIKIDKIYNGLTGVIGLEISGNKYLVPLPSPTKYFENSDDTYTFHCLKSGIEYLLAWWEWYKPKRADDLIDLIKEDKETITSIVLNEESIFLQIEPLNSFIMSKEFLLYRHGQSKYFGYDEYQSYREAIHYGKYYGKRELIGEKVSSDLFKNNNQNKFFYYPRLYRNVDVEYKTKDRAKLDSGVLAFTNFGIYEREFIEDQIKKSVKRNKYQLPIEDGKKRITPKQNKNLTSSTSENLHQHYSNRPISLIIDQVIIE